MDEIQKNEELRNIFQRVAAEYGYSSVNAEYLSTKDLKVRWQRGYNWINFQVSDYLDDAPGEVLEGLAKNICERLNGRAIEFSRALKDWVTRPEFCKQKQPVYIERSMGLLNEVRGEHKDLNDSLKRLQDAGLVGEIPGLYLSWRENNGDMKVGRCSVLMKVVTLSKQLDSEDVPDFVIDYCLYNELVHIIAGYHPDGDVHDIESLLLLKNFTQESEAQQFLKDIEMYA